MERKIVSVKLFIDIPVNGCPCPFCGSGNVALVEYKTDCGISWAAGCADCFMFLEPDQYKTPESAAHGYRVLYASRHRTANAQ